MSQPARRLLGLTGAPGVGKSTVARALVEAWSAAGRTGAVVGMDGFHLSGAELADRGLADVKGAPGTFDADGFAALLRRLRAGGEDVPVPAFDREREQTVPAAYVVAASVELVVVEGNYLLLDGPWRAARELLDEVWFLDLPADLRLSRLIARHQVHGRTAVDAERWVHRSDEANARLVVASRHRADAVMDVASGRVTRGTAAPTDQGSGSGAAASTSSRPRA